MCTKIGSLVIAAASKVVKSLYGPLVMVVMVVIVVMSAVILFPKVMLV